jgi:hypothetical protein
MDLYSIRLSSPSAEIIHLSLPISMHIQHSLNLNKEAWIVVFRVFHVSGISVLIPLQGFLFSFPFISLLCSSGTNLAMHASVRFSHSDLWDGELGTRGDNRYLKSKKHTTCVRHHNLSVHHLLA